MYIKLMGRRTFPFTVVELHVCKKKEKKEILHFPTGLHATHVCVPLG